MALQKQVFSYGDYAYQSATNGYVLELELTQERVDIQQNRSYLNYILRLRSGENNRFSQYHLGARLLLDGKTVALRERENTAQVSLDYQSAVVLLSGSTAVPHEADGTRTVSVAFSIDMASGAYVPGPLTAEGYTMELTPIARCSSLEVGSAVFGQPLELKITAADAAYTHTLSCRAERSDGTDARSATILDRVDGLSGAVTRTWTPPMDWAVLNTTGSTVGLFLVLETFSEGESLGIRTAHVPCAIPETVTPTCHLTVTDTQGLAESYGYIQGMSRLGVHVTWECPYGATVQSIQVSANGTVYTADSFETEPLKSAGTQTVMATIRDSRGRTASCAIPVAVQPYRKPAVSAVTVRRCDAYGLENRQGAYGRVDFRAAISPLGEGKNTPVYQLWYKPVGDTVFTTQTLLNPADPYNVTDGCCVFPAATDKAYDVMLLARDDFGQGEGTGILPRCFTLLHFRGDGTAMGIGREALQPNALDMGLDIYMNGNALHGLSPVLFDMDEQMEWYQPLMEPGVEYRTIARYRNMPVYCRMVEFGDLPASGTKTVTVGAMATVVGVEAIAMKHDGSVYASFPVVFDDGSVKAKYNIIGGNAIHVVVFGDMSGYSARFVLRYTK